MSDKALAQRRAAAQLSTGPITEEGKAASSRNNWKHGLYSKANLTWQDLGMGMMARPCKSSCRHHPCSLVVEGKTKPGGDCLDKTVYLEAFDALMEAMTTGDIGHTHGLLASQLAGAVEVLNQIKEEIADHGALIEQELFGKDGTSIGSRYVANPIMAQYIKLLDSLGINFSELMTTPKSVANIKDEEGSTDPIGDLMQNLGERFGSGMAKRISPATKIIDGDTE